MFSSRQESVTGPIPPGTGVMAAVLPLIFSKSVSPQNTPLSSTLVPTSIMIWFSPIISAVINRALPIALTMISQFLSICDKLFPFRAKILSSYVKQRSYVASLRVNSHR